MAYPSGYNEYSLTVLERLAERYHHRPALHALEVLNEPRWDIPSAVLLSYIEAAYLRIRKFCLAEEVAVVFHDGFRSYREFAGLLRGVEADNLVFDIHRYQCFVQEDVDTDIHGHLGKAVGEWKSEADELIVQSPWWTYVGEWSLGLNPKMLELWAQGGNDLGQVLWTISSKIWPIAAMQPPSCSVLKNIWAGFSGAIKRKPCRNGVFGIASRGMVAGNFA